MKTTKQCTKCKTIRNLSEYQKDKNTKSGYRPTCKECSYASTIRWNRSKKGVITHTWHHQVRHSKTRGHQPPTYTREELSEWMMSSTDFHVMYDNWCRLDYQSDYRPSVDRLDNSIGYTMANIRLVSFRDNYMQYHTDKVKGIETENCKAIVKLTKDGKIVGEYFSVAEALRQHGKKPNNARISAVLTGARKYYLHHRWEYAVR